jgi:hypothetical protein
VARGNRDRVETGLRVLWALLAVALTLVGFAAASCGSGNGQAGSSLTSAISSAGSGLTGGGPSLPGSGLPTTSGSTSLTVTTTSPPDTTIVGVAPGSTGGSGSSDNGLAWWVYALIGALIVALIAGAVWLIRSRRKPTPPAPPPVAVPKSLPERQAILLAEVEGRLGAGWTVVSQTADTAMLERSGEITRITVDEFGTLHEIPSPPS